MDFIFSLCYCFGSQLDNTYNSICLRHKVCALTESVVSNDWDDFQVNNTLRQLETNEMQQRETQKTREQEKK